MKKIFPVFLFFCTTFGFTQVVTQYHQSQFFSSEQFTFSKETRHSGHGTFTRASFSDTGNNAIATGTFTETKKTIVIDPYMLLKDRVVYRDSAIIKTGTYDTLYIKEPTIFYKKGKNLIEFDPNDKTWHTQKRNLYLREK